MGLGVRPPLLDWYIPQVPGRYPTELQKELNELTKRVVSREAKVFDSSSVTEFTDPYPKTDGIHYGPTEARQWASHVATDFRQFMGIDTGPEADQDLDSIPENFDDIPRAIPVKAVAVGPPEPTGSIGPEGDELTAISDRTAGGGHIE